MNIAVNTYRDKEQRTITASEAHSADNTVKKGEKKQKLQIKTSLNARTHTLIFQATKRTRGSSLSTVK